MKKTKVMLVTIRCCQEWHNWLIQFAAQRKLNMSDLIDEALLQFARDKDFIMPPKRLQ